MAIRDKYFPGSSVSRYLPPGERSWEEAVYQSGKPVLDAELNFSQEVRAQLDRLIQHRECPSGWLRGPIPFDPYGDFATYTAGAGDFVSDAFRMRRRTALVGGVPVTIEYTGTPDDNWNNIQLEPATVYGGTAPTVKRTDFVFLEVFRALVSHSPTATNTIQVVDPVAVVDGDTITIGGVALTGRNPLTGAINEFLIDASSIVTAGNIRDAINAIANGFVGICTAELDATVPDQVNLRAVPPGAAGTGITLTTSNGPAFLPNPLVPFAGGVDTINKPTQNTIYRQGNVLAPNAVNLPDEIADPTIGTETTKRIQIQYRIRATGAAQGVNFKTEADGFTNTNVLAWGTTGADVANYPFVKADGASITGNSSAAAYDTIDPGLWIAGDGTEASATALGTVDGYCYAIPICFIFRRNDAYDAGAGGGFAPLDNANGGLPTTHPLWLNPSLNVNIPIDDSDRPDGYYHDAIVYTDIMDLRKEVVPGGIDLKAELERQMTLLLDNEMQTWAIDGADKQDLGAGSGDVSWRFLVCNEIGRDGPPAPDVGDTTRGVFCGNFDHIRRRFADQAVAEHRVFPIRPTDTGAGFPGIYVTKVTGGFTGWQSGDVINIDLGTLNATGLGDWSDSSQSLAGGVVENYWPAGTKVTNVLVVEHDDGHFVTSTNKNVVIDTVVGIGTTHIEITLGDNTQQCTGGIDPADVNYPPPAFPAGLMYMVGTDPAVDDGSRRRIFVELEITYPRGSGTTDTPFLYSDAQPLEPDTSVYTTGTLLENDTSQRPLDFQLIDSPHWRDGFRETALEYAAGDQAGPAVSGTPITANGTAGWAWDDGIAGHELMGVVSSSPSDIRMSRRIFGSATLVQTITDTQDTDPRDPDLALSEYGSSSRLLKVDPTGPNGVLSGAESTLCNVTYFAQDPLPNYGGGGGGYQVAIYYRSAAPQTLGVREGAVATWQLPDPISVEPLVMSRDLWTGQVSVGSQALPFPYQNPSDQIPVNADIPVADFPGEWILSATAQVSIGDFSADVGNLNLHQLVPVDPNQNFSFSGLAVDPEFRAQYKVSDTNAYRPTAISQPLSNPATHKVWMPFLAKTTSDSVLWRENEVILLVVSRYALLDELNAIAFTDGANNKACVALYRTQGILLLASE
jgi:hypothetical protein